MDKYKHLQSLWVNEQRARVICHTGEIQILKIGHNERTVGKDIITRTYSAFAEGKSFEEYVKDSSLHQVIRMIKTGHFGGQEYDSDSERIKNSMKRWKKEGFKRLGKELVDVY